MIYFTEIALDKSGKQEVAETIAFQFFMKELPESIKIPYETKVNHIEYNGGFTTNQIIGIYQRDIEWEGCFFGTYTREDGVLLSAKERSDLIRKFMGRPIRVGFSVPNGADDFIPGEDYWNLNKIGKSLNDAKMNGHIGVYIIQEYEVEIFNYSNVNYRIKLVPHMRQEKIKPTATKTTAVKVTLDSVNMASNNIGKAVKGGPQKPGFAKAKAAGNKAVTAIGNATGKPAAVKPPKRTAYGRRTQ